MSATVVVTSAPGVPRVRLTIRPIRFNADASETFVPNLLHSVYTTQLSILLPHRLGLFLMILAIGSVVDLTHGPARGRAEHFHHLARAALCEVPVMDDTSFDAVNALVSPPESFPICSDAR